MVSSDVLSINTGNDPLGEPGVFDSTYTLYFTNSPLNISHWFDLTYLISEIKLYNLKDEKIVNTNTIRERKIYGY